MISQNISKGVMVRHWLCRITGKDKTYFLEDNMSDRNLFNPTLDRTHQERMESAREILLTLVRKLGTTSILDVGCGLGAWLKVAMEAGISDVAGIDGHWIEKTKLYIPETCFMHMDLEKPFNLSRQFDLVISLEVAEHLHSESADHFVDSLVRHGGVILFSAAIPAQGRGDSHINEQFQHYWAEKFIHRGYSAVDCIRKEIWLQQNVFWWLQQNCVLYVKNSILYKWPDLMKDVVNNPYALSIVHPMLYTARVKQCLQK